MNVVTSPSTARVCLDAINNTFVSLWTEYICVEREILKVSPEGDRFCDRIALLIGFTLLHDFYETLTLDV